MRLIKAQTTNLRNINGKGVKYDIDDQVLLDSTNVALVPKGTTAQRPSSPNNGHVRYNTTVEEFEFYQDSAWRKVRFKEPNSVGITQQTLGNGDASETIFGPLASGDADYPVPAAAQNVIVFIENVFQISTTNYTLEQNPTTPQDGTTINAGSFQVGTAYVVVTSGDTDYTAIGAASNAVGTFFVATGAGAGTGTAGERFAAGYYLEFTSPPDASKPITVLHNFDK
tara:strand:- start:1386 stop:2063 length:678 start_codon:yes stop_codon:yes gene_type:complete